MNAPVLRHHVFSGGDGGTVDVQVCADAPEVTEALERALRRRVMGAAYDDLPVSWHHGESSPWAAAVDLLEAGREDEALALGRLLRWCAQRANGRTRGCWEITRNTEEATR